MKVAVPGASGHIGNCLVRELKKQGAAIKVMVHNFRNDLGYEPRPLEQTLTDTFNWYRENNLIN